MKRAFQFLASVCVGAMSVSAAAQTTPQGADGEGAETADTSNVGVAEIVVTAQKRAQNVQDVPISIEVVSAAKLETFNVGDLREMARFAPNVTVVNNPASDAIYIRGFGSTPGNYGFEPSVALYVDGIYIGRQAQAQGPFFDLQRVEVLRGPQGALFGKNTAAGAISVVTAIPTREPMMSFKALYNFDIKGPVIEGVLSGPISETIGARLAVKYLNQDGWVTNLYNGRKEPARRQALGRLTLRYDSSNAFDYTVKAEVANSRLRGGNNVATAITAVAVPRLTRYAGPNRIAEEGVETKSFLASGTGNLEVGRHTLTSITGYSQYDGRITNTFDQSLPAGGFTVSSNEVGNVEDFYQVSQEIRLASQAGGTLEYLVGAYYDHSVFDLLQTFSFDIRSAPALVYAGSQLSDFHQVTDTISAFGQATLRATDSLRFVGSLRASRTKKRGTYQGRLLSGPRPLQPLTSALGAFSETSVDPSVTIQYDAARDIMLYATYARGSKSGGFVSNTNGTTNATFQYRPEKSENFEVGFKSELADRTIVLNVSAFETRFKDLQTSAFNSATATQVISNAARARSRGVEGFAGYRPTPNLDFSISAAYTDAKYTDYPGASCLATQPTSVCSAAVPASVAANNIAGTPLPYVSKISYTAQGHLRVPTGDDTAFDLTAALSGRSKTFIAVNLSPLYGIQKAHAKLDARLQYGRTDGQWFLALLGKNLTNELTATAAYAIGFPITAVSRAFRHIDQPRSISIEAGFKF